MVESSRGGWGRGRGREESGERGFFGGHRRVLVLMLILFDFSKLFRHFSSLLLSYYLVQQNPQHFHLVYKLKVC